MGWLKDLFNPQVTAVIDGLVYDTDKAEHLVSWSINSYKNPKRPHLGTSNAPYALYRTANGRFFIVNVSIINPITEERAKELLGVREPRVYERLFGRPKDA